MGESRWLVGMELARARAGAALDPGERSSALARAGDAYERARAPSRDASGEAAPPGRRQRAWRAGGRLLARLLGPFPGARRSLEDRLLGPEGGGAGSAAGRER